MNRRNVISETDLMVYILAVERKYYEMLELYGIFREHAARCSRCKNTYFRLMKETLRAFGGREIAVPFEKEIKRVSRDITIWRGLSGCQPRSSAGDGNLSARMEEYARRYQMKTDNVYKIKQNIQLMVDKFLTLKGIFGKRKQRAHTK